MPEYSTQRAPCGQYVETCVHYNLRHDVYYVSTRNVERVSRLVGPLTWRDDINRHVLSQAQVDWLHDNNYIIA